MRNLSDNDIDNLFKKAASESTPEFDPADWTDLTQRLNHGAPVPQAPVFSPLIKAASIAVVTVSLVWLTFTLQSNQNNNSNQNKSLTAYDSSASSSSTVSKPLTKSSELHSSNATAEAKDSTIVTASTVQFEEHTATPLANNSQSKENKTTGNSGKISTDQHQKKSLTGKANQKNADEQINDVSNTRNVSNADTLTKSTEGEVLLNHVESTTERREDALTEKVNPDGTNEKTNNAISIGNVALVGTSANTIESTDGIQGKEKKNPNSAALPGEQRADTIETQTKVTSLDSVEQPLPLDKTGASSGTPSPKDSTNNDSDFSRFVLKASITPDFSSDGFKKTDKVGLNYGAQVEYFLTRHLSVSAGAIWSRKYYSTSDVQYHLVAMEQVQGDCHMWDIPVNFSYYATPSKRFSVFISAGLSSYLMNSEKYTFELTTIYGGTQQYSMEVKNGNNEWFKVMNISLGLQGRLSNHVSFQIEPFLKVPLAEIGAGKVQLSSFGSYFSLLYRFHNKHN